MNPSVAIGNRHVRIDANDSFLKNKVSRRAMNTMNKNMDELAGMQVVGGGSRLNQLIEMMHNKGAKQYRL